MNNNSLMIKKENIFYKIKKWFKNLFGKDEIIEQEIDESNEINRLTERMSFIDSIKVESKDVILSLQKKLKSEDIRIEDLTDQELYEMIELYQKQIEEKKNSLENRLKKLYKKDNINS